MVLTFFKPLLVKRLLGTWPFLSVSLVREARTAGLYESFVLVLFLVAQCIVVFNKKPACDIQFIGVALLKSNSRKSMANDYTNHRFSRQRAVVSRLD